MNMKVQDITICGAELKHHCQGNLLHSIHTLENKKSLNNINSHVKYLEKMQNKLKISKRKEITNIRAEINECKKQNKREKSMKHSWFFEKVNKINRSSARGMRMREREREIFTNIRNETRTITTDPTDIKRITRGYYEQLHGHKSDNIDAMD